jgi:hypothetical protein
MPRALLSRRLAGIAHPSNSRYFMSFINNMLGAVRNGFLLSFRVVLLLVVLLVLLGALRLLPLHLLFDPLIQRSYVTGNHCLMPPDDAEAEAGLARGAQTRSTYTPFFLKNFVCLPVLAFVMVPCCCPNQTS